MVDRQQFVPPTQNELEVSIFGPGYGEALLLHIGAAKWILVDSCLDPVSKQPAALHYLHHLGVDPAEAVKLVVATHWHDDHTHGISTVFRECTTADFVASGAIHNLDFYTLLSSYETPSILASSGVDEFRQIIETLQARRSRNIKYNPPKFACADKTLYRDTIRLPSGSKEAVVTALSPSDASQFQSQLAFSQLLADQEKHRKRVVPPSPNSTSVVLWVNVGQHELLLGADLERTSQNNTGWAAILQASHLQNGQADTFKVPHHGSENAHHPSVWSQLLCEDPLAILSPFCRGRVALPSSDDVRRVTGLTSRSYITSSPLRRQRVKFKDNAVRRTLREAACEIRRVHCGWGQVRARSRIDHADEWHIELFGDACPLNSLYGQS